MVGRKAVAFRMRVQICQPQGLGLGDQATEDASTHGPSSDLLLFFPLQAGRDELGQAATFVIEHPEGAVTGVGHRTCFFDDVAQQSRKIEVCFDEEGGLEDPS